MTTQIDGVFVSELTRALDRDQNRHSEFIGNSIGELMHLLMAVQPGSTGGASATAADIATQRVIGLNLEAISTSPRQLEIGQGAAIANTGAAVLPTTPPALPAGHPGYSPWRIGISRPAAPATFTAVTIPTADNIWYMLECRAATLTLEETRDVLTNPVNRVYEPQTKPVGALSVLEFQLTAGFSNALPPPTAGWIQLWGFRNVTTPLLAAALDFRRGARELVAPGAGLVAANGTHAIIRREMWTEATDDPLSITESGRFAFHYEAIIDGVHCVASTNGAFVNAHDLFDTGPPSPSPGLPSGWNYIYMAPFGGRRPISNYFKSKETPVSATGNCAIILDNVAPDLNGRNVNAISPQLPVDFNYEVGIGTAVCVGAVYSLTSGVTARLLPMWVSGDDCHHRQLSRSITTWTGITDVFLVDNIPAGNILPTNVARSYQLAFGFEAKTPTQGGSGTGCLVLITPGPMTGVSDVISTSNVSSVGSCLLDPLRQEDFRVLDVPAGHSPSRRLGNGAMKTYLVLRSPTGVTGPATTVSDVIQTGAIFVTRSHGFRM